MPVQQGAKQRTMPDQIDTYLASYPSEVAAISRVVRATAQQRMPDMQELWYHSSIGYSVSASPFDRICYIAPMNGYVNLGFFFGTHLEDPLHLLQGTGTRMRHVKVRTLAQASHPALAALMKAARLDGPAAVAQGKANRSRTRSPGQRAVHAPTDPAAALP